MESVKCFTPEVYGKLLEAVERLPKEAIERAPKEITRKGYDTTGYQYQFLVNVLNEVVGCAFWEHSYNILKELEGQWTNGKKYWEITVDFKLVILGTTKSCVGGHKSEMHSDALKGAITNAFKKTAAWFGIGGKAYEGTIDDDYRQPSYDDGNVGSDVIQLKKASTTSVLRQSTKTEEVKTTPKTTDSIMITELLKLSSEQTIASVKGILDHKTEQEVSGGKKIIYHYYLTDMNSEKIMADVKCWNKTTIKDGSLVELKDVAVTEYKGTKGYLAKSIVEVL
jgi:hypothetical protein